VPGRVRSQGLQVRGLLRHATVPGSAALALGLHSWCVEVAFANFELEFGLGSVIVSGQIAGALRAGCCGQPQSVVCCLGYPWGAALLVLTPACEAGGGGGRLRSRGSD